MARPLTGDSLGVRRLKPPAGQQLRCLASFWTRCNYELNPRPKDAEPKAALPQLQPLDTQRVAHQGEGHELYPEPLPKAGETSDVRLIEKVPLEDGSTGSYRGKRDCKISVVGLAKDAAFPPKAKEVHTAAHNARWKRAHPSTT